MNIPSQRLSNQYLARNKFENPGDVVEWLGAVQAQDYPGSLWALGQRTRDASESDVEKAIEDRSIIRTWPMRGTLHFVPAADIHWMLKLLTPRVISRSAGRYRQLGLDDRAFARSKKAIVRALEGGKKLTRTEMYGALEAAKISVAGQRGIHILGHLAQEGLICFSGRRGKQQTFALLDEWMPKARNLQRDEALATLAKRYFTSHGPATLNDFAWWSGLKISEARAALEMVQTDLLHEDIEGQVHWFPPSAAESKSQPGDAGPAAHLLPVYDEYTVAYKDRSSIMNAKYASQTGNAIFRSPIVMNGQVAGTWSRAVTKDAIVVSTNTFVKLKSSELVALKRAAARYGDFLGCSVILKEGQS